MQRNIQISHYMQWNIGIDIAQYAREYTVCVDVAQHYSTVKLIFQSLTCFIISVFLISGSTVSCQLLASANIRLAISFRYSVVSD